MIRAWLDKNARSLAISLIMVLVFIYFLYLTIQGDRGIIAMLRMQNEVHHSEHRLAQVRNERMTLEARVKRMRPDGIDPDLLDEQARKQLDVARPNEMVIIVAPQQNDGAKQQMLQRTKP
ncbi:MAG: septum formation initiator family protein [Alphaproteobacteria bacterium]